MIDHAITISDSILEDMLATQVPCGGVEHLGIPACGSPASLVVDRRNAAHPCCRRPVGAAAFKCVACYQMWLEAIVQGMVSTGMVACGVCHGHFDSLHDFARYVPL